MRLDRRRSAQSKRLARLLDLHFNEAFGWWIAILEDVDKKADPGPTYYPGGPTADYPPPVIKKPLDAELGADWEGEPGALIEALCSAGFLERRGDGAVAVLDYWDTFAGAWVWDKLKKRHWRAEKKRTRISHGTVTGRSHNTDSDSDSYTNTNADADADTDAGTGVVSESVSADSHPFRKEESDAPDYGPPGGQQPNTGIPPAASTGGSGHPNTGNLGDVTASLVEGIRPQRLNPVEKARQIMSITGEPPVYLEWWVDVVKKCARVPEHAAVLVEGVNYVRMCADPAQREAKDLGELKRPGAYIAGKLRNAGVQLPPPPAVRKRPENWNG